MPAGSVHCRLLAVAALAWPLLLAPAPGAAGGELSALGPVVRFAQALPVAADAPALSIEVETAFTIDRGTHGVADRGDVITYIYAVTNTGTVPVTNVYVNDAHGGAGPLSVIGTETLVNDAPPFNDSSDTFANDGRWSTLAPGDMVVFIATYSVTQADIDRQ